MKERAIERLKLVGSVIVLFASVMLLAWSCGTQNEHYFQERRKECESHKFYGWPAPDKKADCFRLYPELSK